MNHPNILNMRIDGLDASDLTRMLDRNHARGKFMRRQQRMVMRTRVTRILATVIMIGIMTALGAW